MEGRRTALQNLPIGRDRTLVLTKMYPDDDSEHFYADNKVVRTLARGMMGKVVLVKSSEDNQQLKVVKQYNKKTSESDSDSEMRNIFLFSNEVTILQGISHKYIIGNIEPFIFRDEFIIRMPYHKEGSLKSFLPNLTRACTEKYMLQLSSAIFYLHNRKIVHRDIKPSNVLITDERDVVIIDFGLSIALQPDSKIPSRKCGTDGYIAPELHGPRTYNFNFYKCDMYSLGGVYVNMMFRRARIPSVEKDYLPFVRIQKHIPAAYRNLAENLLNIDPNLRWDSRKLIAVLTSWPSLAYLVPTL